MTELMEELDRWNAAPALLPIERAGEAFMCMQWGRPIDVQGQWLLEDFFAHQPAIEALVRDAEPKRANELRWLILENLRVDDKDVAELLFRSHAVVEKDLQHYQYAHTPVEDDAWVGFGAEPSTVVPNMRPMPLPLVPKRRAAAAADIVSQKRRKVKQ